VLKLLVVLELIFLTYETISILNVINTNYILTYETISVLSVININYIHYSGYNVTKRERIQ